jgi:hypothetical protein
MIKVSMKKLLITICRLSRICSLVNVFFRQYSTLLHLPPLRFHCADGCWDRTQDRCNWCIGSQKP